MNAETMTAAAASNKRIKELFDLQGGHHAVVRARSAAERIAVLRRVRAAIEASQGDVLDALARDLGKPPEEAMQDFGAALWEIGMIEAGLEQWMAPRPVRSQRGTEAGVTACIVSEPKGRIVIFGPWNFPFALVMQPLVAAVAAGNCVIVKPSEHTPATAAIIARIIAECFPENEVAVVEGGPEVAEHLLSLPFDHIFFTGSTATGRRVMAAAADHLSSVTLELGGKCPVIVDENTDLSAVVQAVKDGKFFNAGQICLSPDHVWLPRAMRDAFVAMLDGAIGSTYYQDGSLQKQRIARIINDRHAARLRHLIDDAVRRGATVARGGALIDGALEPTIVLDVPLDAAIMQEEIFGPVLPVLAYDSVDDALLAIGKMGKPLALYIFSEDPQFVDSVLSRTSSGGVTINGVMQHATEPELPFGGVGASGMGAYHGAYSFAELTHRRSILIEGPVAPAYCR